VGDHRHTNGVRDLHQNQDALDSGFENVAIMRNFVRLILEQYHLLEYVSSKLTFALLHCRDIGSEVYLETEEMMRSPELFHELKVPFRDVGNISCAGGTFRSVLVRLDQEEVETDCHRRALTEN
jgi:hypothetical protein